MTRPAPARPAVSAGGVVWRRGPQGDVQVVVCGRQSEDFWGLPKGTPDAGETLERTAQREVEEETGLEVRVGEKLGSIHYWFVASGERYHKRVHHWLMEPVGGDIANHDAEFEDVAWMPIADAIRRLKFENERRMVRKAAAVLGVKV
ncbi:MAG: NUDIX hydrolase [Dehalococcoidia bacterium]|nr:MAG: NUDIX hydrolase [bacterium]MCE7927182.1 NUDIX hydrolase [Chloroflexi bacterium CFX7]MCL4230112.1 NUDIX hydrolase [Dehalococcoidia bacterium]NUQ54704.1 NUDIX hydrolase [Dehalococcoidia bacterium]